MLTFLDGTGALGSFLREGGFGRGRTSFPKEVLPLPRSFSLTKKFLSCVAHGVKVWHKRMWYNGRERKVSFMKMNLKSGFLLMYDWWPILENLPADCFKELMVALVERQRYGTPMPQFSDLRCELYFRVIEPTIERRLDGQ